MKMRSFFGTIIQKRIKDIVYIDEKTTILNNNIDTYKIIIYIVSIHYYTNMEV